MRPYPGFCGASNAAPESIINAERTVNFYPTVQASSDGNNRMVFNPTPGKAVFCTLPTYPVRGQFSVEGRMFAVGGSVLYEVFTGGTCLARGAMATNSNPATLSSSGVTTNELFVTSGRQGYIYNLSTNAFTNVVADVDQGGYINARFVALDWVTGTFQWSDILDGLTWNALNQQQRIDAGDGWSGMWVGFQEVWLLGKTTGQVWGTTEDQDQPFAPLTNTTLEYGIYAGFTITKCASEPMWLSVSEQGYGVVMRASSYTPTRVSTDTVEASIAAMIKAGTASDVVAWSYEEDGRAFYVLNFPTGGKCWVFDVVTNLWHERGEWNIAGMDFDAQRQQYHCVAFNQHMVGDRITGDIYIQSESEYLDNTTVIRRLRRPPAVRSGVTRFYFHRLEILMGVGLGLPAPAAPPYVTYRYSDDGGKTWSNERQCSAGNLGDYAAVVHWDGNGSAYNRQDEIVVSDPVPWYIDSAYLEITQGDR